MIERGWDTHRTDHYRPGTLAERVAAWVPAEWDMDDTPIGTTDSVLWGALTVNGICTAIAIALLW